MKAPLERTKEIELDERKYQLVRMDPRVGSWILAQLSTLMMPAQVEQQLGKLLGGNPLASSRKQMSEEEFANIQDHCLRSCNWYDTKGATPNVPTPILHNGRFADPSLQYDLVAVAALTVHALFFNLSPFFDKSALNGVAASFGVELDIILSNAQGLMNTSGDQ